MYECLLSWFSCFTTIWTMRQPYCENEAAVLLDYPHLQKCTILSSSNRSAATFIRSVLQTKTDIIANSVDPNETIMSRLTSIYTLLALLCFVFAWHSNLQQWTVKILSWKRPLQKPRGERVKTCMHERLTVKQRRSLWAVSSGSMLFAKAYCYRLWQWKS